MSHDDQASVRQQFNRRFVFGLHAVASVLISLLLFLLVFTHPLNTTVWDGQTVWAGYARPDLMYVASILLGMVGLHGLWVLRREGRLDRRRRLGFALHALLATVGAALTFSYLNSWYFNESYKWVDYYAPVSPGSPPALVVYAVLLFTIAVSLALPVHGGWLLYHELLARSLRRAAAKPKREEDAPMIGDDGELSEWIVEETKAKQSS
ncbi:MAG: hypothetical protein IT319_15425 [Anaerolineae bacterium]|nr:hypothetical protein [Anaerolineae bacterium]